MDLKDKIKATVKNLEGKVQEAVGDLTHNSETKAEGQRKQAEAEEQISQNAEEHKDTETHEDEDKEVIEPFKTFEGNDKIEQRTSF